MIFFIFNGRNSKETIDNKNDDTSIENNKNSKDINDLNVSDSDANLANLTSSSDSPSPTEQSTDIISTV